MRIACAGDRRVKPPTAADAARAKDRNLQIVNEAAAIGQSDLHEMLGEVKETAKKKLSEKNPVVRVRCVKFCNIYVAVGERRSNPAGTH